MKLRGKFLTLLVLLPSLCLGLFLFFAYNVFVDDKQASVLESHFLLLNSANLTLTLAPPTKVAETLSEIRKQEGFETLLAMDSAGRLLNEPTRSLESILGSHIFQKLIGQTADEGGFEARNLGDQKTLVSFLKIKSEPPLTLLLTTPSEGGHRAALLFLLKAGCTFLALVSIAVIVSIVFSNKLTGGITALSGAMVRFGKGELDVVAPEIRTQDEVADMGRTFGQMRLQIKDLIVEREDKARLETEFQLAGDLQRRFLPTEKFALPELEFQGYFEPAKFAGGDWWFYFQTETQFIFMIGDVTGHGINSAMMTGVARSAMSLISTDFGGTAKAMAQLNRVFCESGRGELNMTCFLGALDLRSGLLEYTNASHEVPYVLPAIDRDLKKKDFGTLASQPGPRLGENLLSTYSSSTLELQPMDLLFVYSDGLVELEGTEEQGLFGDRNLLKILGTNHQAKISASALMEKINNRISEFRGDKDLRDDLSFFAIKWKGKT